VLVALLSFRLKRYRHIGKFFSAARHYFQVRCLHTANKLSANNLFFLAPTTIAAHRRAACASRLTSPLLSHAPPSVLLLDFPQTNRWIFFGACGFSAQMRIAVVTGRCGGPFSLRKCVGGRARAIWRGPVTTAFVHRRCHFIDTLIQVVPARATMRRASCRADGDCMPVSCTSRYRFNRLTHALKLWTAGGV
jgi:hypothetical protein